MKKIHPNSTESYTEERSSGRSRSFRQKIYTLLIENPEGLTDRMIMAYLNERDPNNIRPEITRLKKAGMVKEIGKIKCAWTGKKVRVTRAINIA